MTTYHVHCDSGSMPWCCGIWELGNFVQSHSSIMTSGWNMTSQISIEDAWDMLIKQVREQSRADTYVRARAKDAYPNNPKIVLRRLIVCNLYADARNPTDFKCADLIPVLERQPDLILNHQFTNANTANQIRTFILSNDL